MTDTQKTPFEIIKDYDVNIPEITDWKLKGENTEFSAYDNQKQILKITLHYNLLKNNICDVIYTVPNLDFIKNITYEDFGSGTISENDVEYFKEYLENPSALYDVKKQGSIDKMNAAIAKKLAEGNVNGASLVSRVFKDDKPESNVIYCETFANTAPNPKSVCKLTTKDNNKILGYRYYYNDSKYFSVLLSDKKYVILKSPGITNDTADKSIPDMLHEIYGNFYKDKHGYEITGSLQKTRATMAAIAQRDPNQNPNCIVIPTIKSEKDFCSDNFSIDTLLTGMGLNPADITPSIVMVPVTAKGHITLLLIDRANGNKCILLDSSLAHTKLMDKTKLRPSIFGNIATDMNTEVLPSQISLQINGCCSFWVDSLAEVISSNAAYKDMAAIKTASENGTLWLEAAAIMSKTFDISANKPTVKVFESQKEAEDEKINYVTFKIGDKFYGINIKCWDNRFVNIEKLTDILPSDIKADIKQRLQNQIEKQNLVKSFESSIHEYKKLENSLKIFNNLIEKRNSLNTEQKNEFDEFLDNVEQRAVKFVEAAQANGNSIVSSAAIAIFDKIIGIIKSNQNLSMETEPILSIKQRYENANPSLITSFEQFITLVKQEPPKSIDMLKQDENYIALNQNSISEKGGEVLAPRVFKTFCMFYVDAVAEMKAKNETDKKVLLDIVEISDIQKRFEDSAVFEIEKLEHELRDTAHSKTEDGFSKPKILAIPHISSISIYPFSEPDTTTLSIKTNNKEIFRDIEEIQITLPKDIKEVTEEYLNKLYKEIIDKSFANDIITLDNVKIRKENREEYEPIEKFTNFLLVTEYRNSVRGREIKRDI